VCVCVCVRVRVRVRVCVCVFNRVVKRFVAEVNSSVVAGSA